MLKVSGYSDDIIDLTGDLNEEFGRFNSEGDYLAFSDGTLLHAEYDENGLWRFKVVSKGELYDKKEEGSVTEDTNDIVYFKPGMKWCVCGKDLAV